MRILEICLFTNSLNIECGVMRSPRKYRNQIKTNRNYNFDKVRMEVGREGGRNRCPHMLISDHREVRYSEVKSRCWVVVGSGGWQGDVSAPVPASLLTFLVLVSARSVQRYSMQAVTQARARPPSRTTKIPPTLAILRLAALPPSPFS